MCLILLSFMHYPDYPLILAANRDEDYIRSTSPAHFWQDAPYLLAGRDEQNGGTWLGITTSGKLALLTNFRNPMGGENSRPSRGKLVSDFLQSRIYTKDYLEHLKKIGRNYNSFNLICGTVFDLYYFTNQEDREISLTPGIHGLSNRYLNTPWPKVERGKKALKDYLQDNDSPSAEGLFDLLQDTTRPEDEQLPDTGIGLEMERFLSPMFIQGQEYGTRSSTIILVNKHNQVHFQERNYNSRIDKNSGTPVQGEPDRVFRFLLSPPPPG